MTIDQVRANVKSGVWRGIAQSGADLSTLAPEQQNKLVDSITNSVLVAVNDLMEDTRKANQDEAPQAAEDGEEKVLWEGRPFLSLVEFYTLTNERIKLVKGMFGKDVENVELIRIQDIDVTQNLSERIFNIGDIIIRGADLSNPQITLRNVNEPQQVYETLRRAWLDARKRYGLQFREQM